MQKRVLPSTEVSLASKAFEKFFAAQELEDIIEHYKDFCALLQITPGPLSQFYPVLKVFFMLSITELQNLSKVLYQF